MKKLILALVMVTGTSAMADGFVCENSAYDIKVKVFNKVNPQDGTRNSAVMILSNPSISHGRKTIATFQADNSLLTNASATYTALVDLRFTDSSRKGELLAGSKLGNVKDIILDVDFTYARPVEDGEEMSGELVLTHRNGDEDTRVDIACTRYLKH